ncbi:MAG: PAS domain-containing protein [Ignavibacteriales bacterium]|nr:MAG: PAS domain-containing protein [Ignavibacteriales bacterium]
MSSIQREEKKELKIIRDFSFPDDYSKVVYYYDQVSQQYKYMSSDIIMISGYSVEELNLVGFKSIVKETVNSKRNSFTQNSGNDEEIFEEFSATYIIETKDKKIRWVEDNSFTKLDFKGNRIFSIGVLRDITEFRENIFNLINSKKRLDAILKLADVAFLLIDQNKKVSLINRKGAELFGVDDIVGADFGKLFTGRIKGESQKLFRKFITSYDDDQKVEVKFNTSRDEHLILWQKTLLKDEKRKY